MRVAIEARALSASGGVHRYVHQLIASLLELGGVEYTIVYDSTEQRGTFIQANEIVAKLAHEALLPTWLSQKVMPRLQELAPDVVHFTKSAIPRQASRAKGGQLPIVVTIHDVIPELFPASQRLAGRLYWPRTLRHAATASDHVLTISEASKRDIIRRYDIPDSKITVVPLAVDTEQFQPAGEIAIAQVQEKLNVSAPYVLFVGTLEPRKNVAGLLRAWKKISDDIPHQLVIAGRDYKGGKELRRLSQQLGLADRVRWLSFVDEADLPALLSGATAFIWPSIYEGWGLPPAEAMACGTPAIVSDGGALPEAVGEAGLVVPFSTGDLQQRTHDERFELALADAMATLLTDDKQRLALAQAGLAQVKQQTWRMVAERTREVYQRVAAL